MRNTGGPAFPRPTSQRDNENGLGGVIYSKAQEGMTLRDYFAAQAMNGLLSNRHFEGHDACLVPKAAYAVADAMLEERENEE